MRLYSTLTAAVLATGLSFGQLTMDQKLADFQYMAGVYAKRYGPYEWKRDTFKVDLLDISAWLDKVRATKSDLEYYDVMSAYVAGLNDAHDTYYLPSGFFAYLNFTVDIFEGKLLVDQINRARLPVGDYPFVRGYELVSIDGEDASKILDRMLRYSVAANDRSTRRLAAELITYRPQQAIPSAADVPETSTVVFRRPDGNLESYRIRWSRTGLPFTSIGKYTTPGSDTSGQASSRARVSTATGDLGPRGLLRGMLRFRVPIRAVLNVGSVAPVFAGSFPASFVQRLGKSSTDPFYSGVFDASGLRIGYIRIPTFEPADIAGAETAFFREISFFQANTDGLIVDVMRNFGGDPVYSDDLFSLLAPDPWSTLELQVRVTSEWVTFISDAVESAKFYGYPDEYIEQLEAVKQEFIQTNRKMRGLSNPVPVEFADRDRAPLTDSRGNLIAYQKPVMLLVDEMSASAAELFAATFQDNARGPVVGWRTMGAGGNVETWEAGSYSQGFSSVTESLLVRKDAVVSQDYPSAPYIENIGVRPDIPLDIMTADNLVRNGKPFLDVVVAAMVDHIQKSR
jgi:hypothetical protein